MDQIFPDQVKMTVEKDEPYSTINAKKNTGGN
jgi:hypothetical protein